MNKTSTKKASKKTATTKRANKTVATNTYVCENIGRLESGMYRARKCVQGVKYSRNFSSIRAAKTWVNSL